MKILRLLGLGIGALVALLALVALAARLSDGPIGPFAGGPLLEGELVSESDVDWSPHEALGTIEFQLLLPPRSRTVWFALYEGALYIPCGAPNFKLLKQWPHEAMEDGRSVLRVAGRRYERQAVRVTDPAVTGPVLDLVSAKYGLGDTEDAGPDDVWIFRMDPRAG